MATPNDAIEIKEEPMDDDDVVMVPSPSVTPNTTVKKEERVSEVIILRGDHLIISSLGFKIP